MEVNIVSGKYRIRFYGSWGMEKEIEIPKFIDKEILSKSEKIGKLIEKFLDYDWLCRRYVHRKKLCEKSEKIREKIKEEIKEFYDVSKVEINSNSISIWKNDVRIEFELKGKHIRIRTQDSSYNAVVEAELVDKLIVIYFVINEV